MRLIFVLITALFISLIVTFFTREFAIKHKFGVFPDQRKVHKSFMPHMGGIGIFSGFISGLLLAIFIIPEFSDILLKEYLGILIASILIFIV